MRRGQREFSNTSGYRALESHHASVHAESNDLVKAVQEDHITDSKYLEHKVHLMEDSAKHVKENIDKMFYEKQDELNKIIEKFKKANDSIQWSVFMFSKSLEALRHAKRYRKRELFDPLLKDYASNDYLGLSVKKGLLQNAFNKLQSFSTHSPRLPCWWMATTLCMQN